MAENTEQVRIQVTMQGAEEASASLRRLGESVSRINQRLNSSSASASSYASGMQSVESSTGKASKAAQQLGGVLGTLSGQLKLAAAITFTQAIGGQIAGALGIVRSGILTFNAVLETAQVGLGTLVKNRAELDAYAAANIEITRTSADAAQSEKIRAEMTKKYAVSQEEANAMAQQQVELLRQFANVTPFYFTGLTKAAVMMQAFGFRMEEILRKDDMGKFQGAIVAIGDAVAALGGGDETIMRIAYALGQMKSAGRVYQNDMMQLANAGIAGYQILGKALMDDLEKAGQQSSALYKSLVNNPVEVIRQMAKQGKLSGEAAAEAILAGLNERYGGGMKRFQKTFQASLSTLSDTSQSLVAVAFKPLFYYVRDSMVNLANELQTPAVMQAAARFQELIYGLVGVMKMLAPVVRALAVAIGDKLNNAIMNLNFDSMMNIANPMLKFFSTLKAALTTVADFLQNKFGQSFTIAASGLILFMKFLSANPMINFVVGLAAALGILRQAFDENTYGIRDLLMPVIEGLVNGGKQAAEMASAFGKAFLDAFSGALVGAIQTFAQVFGGVLDVFKGIASVLAPNVDALKTLGSVIGSLAAMMVLKKVIVDGFIASLFRLGSVSAATAGKSGMNSMFGAANNYFNPGMAGLAATNKTMQAKGFAKLPSGEQARVTSLNTSYKALSGTLGKVTSAVGGMGMGFMMLGTAVGMVNPQIGGLITILGALMMMVPMVVQGIVALRAAMAAAQGSMMAFFASPAGIALLAIGALAIGIAVFTSGMRDETEALRNSNEQMENQYISAKKLTETYSALSETAQHVANPTGTDLWSTERIAAYNEEVDKHNSKLEEGAAKLQKIEYWYTQEAVSAGIFNGVAISGMEQYNSKVNDAIAALSKMGTELETVTRLQELLHQDPGQFQKLQQLKNVMGATGKDSTEILRSGWYEIQAMVKQAFPEASRSEINKITSNLDSLNDVLTADELAWVNAANAVDPFIRALEEATGLVGQAALDYTNMVAELNTTLANLIDQNKQDEAQAAYERKLKLLTGALDNAQEAADAASRAFKRAFDQFKFFYDQLVARLSMVFNDKLNQQVEELKKQAEEAVRAIQLINLGESTTVGALRDQLEIMKEMIDDRERLKALQEASLTLQRAELGLYDASKDPFEAAIAMREAAQSKDKAVEQYTIATMEDTLQGAQTQIDAIQAQYDTLLNQLKNDQAMLQSQFQSYYSDYLDFIQGIADGELTLAQANKKFQERYGVENVFGSTKKDKAKGWDNFLAGGKQLFGVDLGDLKMPDSLTNFGKNFGENFKSAAVNLAKWLRDKWPALMKKAMTVASTAIAVDKANAAVTGLTPPTPQKAKPSEMDYYMQLKMVNAWNESMAGSMSEYSSRLSKAGKSVYAAYFMKELGPQIKSALEKAMKLTKTTPVDALKFTDGMDQIYLNLQTRMQTRYNQLAGIKPSTGPVPKASGGLIQRGGQYLVGERGPELFVSNNRGMILPASVTQALMGASSGGGSAGSPTVNIYNPVVRDDRDIRKMAEKVSAAQNRVLRSYGRR